MRRATFTIRSMLLVTLIAAIIFVVGSILLRREPPPTSREVLTQLFAERERLYAGDVRIRGVERRVSSRQKVNINNSRDIVDRIRFDFSRGRAWHEQELNNLAAQPLENPLHQVTVFAADGAYAKSVEAKSITISARQPPSHFWDVRAFGMATAVDLMDFTKLTMHKSAFTHYLDRNHVSIEGPDANGIVIATIEHGSDPGNRKKIDGRSRFWIDTSRGHVPIRMEGQELDAQASTAGRRAWRPPNHWSTTSWELIDEVWVPTSFKVKHVVGIPDVDSFTISFDLAIEWFSVNPDFTEEDFSIAKLDTPKGSHLVVDRRIDSAKPVIVQHPGIEDVATLKRIDANATEPPAASSSSGKSSPANR